MELDNEAALALANTNTPLSKPHLPGDLAMWFFILAELTVFAIFFIGFAITRQLYPDMFQQGQSYLHPAAGGINTFALISSSCFVALSLNAIRQSRHTYAAILLAAALLMASVYLAVKTWEYNQLLDLGYGLSSNTYFTLYFFITGFHFLHVILGMIILGFMAFRTINGAYQGGNLSGFESGACYWHMVDLVWIILFPLLYVID
ncbi:cytochrome c oxidase subunit 3 family protein [Shewanella abyssi]|uniref:cytochrome c oxidase subunit 3 family protein n=1 Tax=Shewanella abyssi TaxID=311789 RepID=UPI00200CC380|nr:cytochrome c oxidase subunit 3 family protein [Shewanella abyssi]MCL1050157.1 cytochrome c oxidase subunit 3 family protein [Shewanella abyssi]